MKSGRRRFRDILIWVGGLFIMGATIIFLVNLNAFWVPAIVGFIFILAVIVYLVMGGFGVE
jgi:uncharacterized membrane protein